MRLFAAGGQENGLPSHLRDFTAFADLLRSGWFQSRNGLVDVAVHFPKVPRFRQRTLDGFASWTVGVRLALVARWIGRLTRGTGPFGGERRRRCCLASAIDSRW